MKPLQIEKDPTSGLVAPRRGAWIETRYRKTDIIIRRVAPRRGAWIETTRDHQPLYTV